VLLKRLPRGTHAPAAARNTTAHSR
jgi:hypothetical protein